MAKSIIQDDKSYCFLCGVTFNIWSPREEHHIFNSFNRENSEKYGLKVYLCHKCHNEPPYGVHHNSDIRRYLERIGQKAFERRYINLNFVNIFGENYLDWRN